MIDGGCVIGIMDGGSSSDRCRMSDGVFIDNALVDHILTDDGILMSNDRCLLHNTLIHILVNIHILLSTTILLITTHSQHNLRICTKLLLPRTTPTLVHIHVLALLTQRKHRLRAEHPVHLPLQHR